MSFEWKDRNSIFKGEGIYHLTFAIAGRQPLLGQLVAIENATHKSVNRRTKFADVEYTHLGHRINQQVEELEKRFPYLKICAKVIMPDHLHLVVWIQVGYDHTIRQIARGFAQGCSKIAREIAHSAPISAAGASISAYGASISAPSNGAITNPTDPYDCGNGAHTLFSIPFIRTLSRKGQLSAMISYVHANPDNAWMRRLNPDLYTIRRRQQYANLHFDCMGKSRLLDYPDRQVIALSRSLSPEQIEAEVQKALRKAENGTITYTAAINTGEKAVARAVREAGHPLVVMMLDGFPAEGTEAARYYHPSGVYHKACGDGLLFLMAPLAENYSNPTLITLTDAELKHKDEAKGYQYRPIPHDTKRWRMIAGNIMLKMIAQLLTL